MRIYNGTKSTLTLPYSGGENLTIASKTPSGNVLCSSEFLSMLVTSYDTNEVAIIASGPFELSACANVPTATNYVVQSLDEAIKRFMPATPKKEEKEEKKPAPKPVQPTAPTPTPASTPKSKEEIKEDKKELKPVESTPKKKEEKKEDEAKKKG